jgi:hypothetical protein
MVLASFQALMGIVGEGRGSFQCSILHDRSKKLVILNLFQDNNLPLRVILKQVQDDE